MVSAAPSFAREPGSECLLPPGITAEQVLDHLAHVLASSQFNHSERMNRFLRFVVETALAGRQEQLKEYLIGVEVFDRNHDYDPHLDPIVRVDARRLRAKPKEYYENQTGHDVVVISLPKGSYVPLFERRIEPEATAKPHLQRRGERRRQLFERRETEARSRAAEDPQRSTAVRKLPRLPAKLILACFFLFLGSLALVWLSWRQLHPAKPSLSSLTLLAAESSGMGRPGVLAGWENDHLFIRFRRERSSWNLHHGTGREEHEEDHGQARQ